MRMTPATSEVFAGNRAMGAVEFDVHVRDGLTRRHILHEAGSLRVRFPTPEQQGLSAVFVNTAGGIAGGDRFDIRIAAGADAKLTVTTAAAEKVYRSHGPDAELNIHLSAAEGSHLTWLPQETILFDRARIVRRINIDLLGDASLLLGEIVVFGRTAMAEMVQHGRFVDRWRLTRDGKLIFAETSRLEGNIGEKLARAAIAGGGVAIGTALIVPGADKLVERLRAATGGVGGEFGISAWNGFAIARFCAQDAARLRSDMMNVLALASPERLPRLWLS